MYGIVRVFLVLSAVLVVSSGHYYEHSYGYKFRHRRYLNCVNGVCFTSRGEPPACLKWCLVRVSNGFCESVQYQCCRYRERLGFCPRNNMFCKWPMPYYVTEPYQCFNDFNCPAGQKCCEDSCFVHKICKPCFYFDWQYPESATVAPSTVEAPQTTSFTEIITPITIFPTETTTSTDFQTKPDYKTTISEEDTTNTANSDRSTEEGPTSQISTTSEASTNSDTSTIPEITSTYGNSDRTTEEAVSQSEESSISTIEVTTTTEVSDTTATFIITSRSAETTITTTMAEDTTDALTTDYDLIFGGSGSGDWEDVDVVVPEPEAAKLMSLGKYFYTFTDDEDIKKIMNKYKYS